jgi:hypothetical protein
MAATLIRWPRDSSACSGRRRPHPPDRSIGFGHAIDGSADDENQLFGLFFSSLFSTRHFYKTRPLNLILAICCIRCRKSLICLAEKPSYRRNNQASSRVVADPISRIPAALDQN